MPTRFPTDNHGWAELLPARNPCPSLQGNHRFAWVVIGAGLTGLACARRRAAWQPGDEIAVLEARQVAQGASAQAASVEETSASLEELSSMAKQNANNAQSASTLS